MNAPDQEIESAIVSAGADVAPRITPADVEANIIGEYFFTASNGVLGAILPYTDSDDIPFDSKDGLSAWDIIEKVSSLKLLTFCVLVLRNGFTVTGESACASPENFNAEIGRRIARENAVAKIWPLMGYELRTRIATTTKEN